MKKPLNIKKFLLPNIPYVFIALFATKLGQAWRLAPGMDFSGKALHLMEGFAAAFQSALPSFHPIDLCVGVAAALLIRLIVYVKGKNAKKFRKNLEYGSARWGRPEDIAPYVDPKFENNVILTQTERLMMSNRPKDPKTARNKNVLVVGGSGSGKTRFFIKPNLMQLHSSYVVTDPKGSIAVECGKLMLRNGYKVKIFNSINFKKSHHYNPFAYIHSEKDILKLVTTLIANTKGDGKSGDDFWQKAETLLYTALIGYIHYEAPEEEQNFATLIEFINAMEVREDDEDFKNPVDLMFEELKKRKPDPKPAFRARVAIVGSEIDDPQLTKLIEGCGALVVSDRYCFGSTPGREIIELKDDEEALPQICMHIMQHSECARYIADEKVQQRRETADRLAREYHADGIIYEQMKYCDYWGFERALVSYIMHEEYNWPVLSIDRLYNNGNSGQLRTRVQAFVESLEIKRIQKNGGTK